MEAGRQGTGSQRWAPVKLAFAANARAGTMGKERGATRVIGLASAPAQLYPSRPSTPAVSRMKHIVKRPRALKSSTLPSPPASSQTHSSLANAVYCILALIADNASHTSKASALSTPATIITAPHGPTLATTLARWRNAHFPKRKKEEPGEVTAPESA